MKKLLAILMLVCFTTTMIYAQGNKPAAKKAATETKAAPTKKDGTPDMRFKENKEAAKATAAPAGPTKKDGTPDMRYKANKTAPAKK